MNEAKPNPIALPPDHRINIALKVARKQALEAIALYDDNEALSAPLRYVGPTLQRFNMVAATGMAGAGFVVDEEVETVFFNVETLDRIIAYVEQAFNNYPGIEVQTLVSQSVGLYLYHELFHIEQNFEDHDLASIIRSAFGSDELSKLDVYADVVAAHCQALIDFAGQPLDRASYLSFYGSNLTLSYDILAGAFESTSDHKKRRGLGLMTVRYLVERAMRSGATEDMVDDALLPAYTSVALDSGHIISLTIADTGWTILFYAHAADPSALQKLWDRAGVAKPDELLRLLYATLGEAVLDAA